MNKLLERKNVYTIVKPSKKTSSEFQHQNASYIDIFLKTEQKKTQLKSPNSRRNPLKIEHQSIMTEQNLNISKSLNDYSKNVYTIVNMNQINGKTRDTSIHGMRMFIISIHT